MNIIFNPQYILKPDEGRALLLPKEGTRVSLIPAIHFDAYIHPVHAMILTFMDGRDISECIQDAANYLSINEHKVSTFVHRLLDYDQFSGIEITKDNLITFPPNTIISCNGIRRNNYSPDAFLYDALDVRFKQHATPTTITLMINNKCATDCIYCYADRRNAMDCSIPLKRIRELISEAKLCNVSTFDVIGGEFFLYRHWRELLLQLQQHSYSPFLSTKIPLSESTIKYLADAGIEDLQISLDSLMPGKLCSMLKVRPNYQDQIETTIRLLEKYGIKTLIHTIVTSENDNLEDMQSLYQFLQQIGNIHYWKIDLCGPSMYLQNRTFESLKPSDDKIIHLIDYFKLLKPNSHFPILYGGLENIYQSTQLSFEEKKNKFSSRGLCTGNYSHLFILPDGKVTICEELYWHPQFIIGDITDMSLQQVWTGEKAIALQNISQKSFNSDSACKSCRQFEDCHHTKGVCWRDIMKAYGPDKWYYPDINCPKAPLQSVL